MGGVSRAVGKSLYDTLRSLPYMYLMKYKLKKCMPGSYLSYYAFKKKFFCDNMKDILESLETEPEMGILV